MKIISIQGNFGNLYGKCVEFSEGFTASVLPNGWGKTTLCAFLRIMFYGLNTSKRDTQEALSDKTRFFPRDGRPMSGRLVIKHQGRVLVISRTTGKGGLMQEFDAFYEDTNEKCTFLNAKNCGEVLLGIGEDGFLSSIFIDGSMLMRQSGELRERMLAMAQTGDTQARAAAALQTLDRWRLDLDSGNGHGIIPVSEAALAEMRGKLEQLVALEEEITRQRAQVQTLQQAEQAARAAYDKAYRAYATETTGTSTRLDALIAESERLVHTLDKRVPPEPVIKAALEALYGYEGAIRLEREKREKLPDGRTRYGQAVEALEREKREYEIACNRAKEPHVRWFPLMLALAFASASALTFMLDIDWGTYTQYVPWALSGLAVVGLATAFIGNARSALPPPRNFDAEKEELRRLYAQEGSDQDTASSVLRDAYDALLQAAQAIDPSLTSIEQAEAVVRGAQEDLQSLRREKATLQELLMQRKLAPTGGTVPSGAIERLRKDLAAARFRADEAVRMLAQQEGYMQALGKREEMEAECARMAEKLQQAREKHAAVCEAIAQTRSAQVNLSARIAPKIAEKTREYMDFLSDGTYTEVRLNAELQVRTAGEDGLLLDPPQLSAGTRDQLYFVLRLAVADVLGTLDEPAPLILDDPFLTFDDAHTARGIELLRHIAKERQVILFSCRTLPSETA